ncbi:hypothetical protein F5146DRAFT_1206560 [Armillaria mellea]|nr:hypothetical protein F5146DRAFT_1206560 [Armillaria mellea]
MDSKNFHFAVLYRGDEYQAACARHQNYLFSRLNLRAGMRVLEVGCGRGTAVVELANFASVSVVGIDKDPSSVDFIVPVLIEYASRSAQVAGVADRTSFVIGDYLVSYGTGFHISYPCSTGDIASLVHQFSTRSFDAIYSIESLKHLRHDAGLPYSNRFFVEKWRDEFLEDQTGVGWREITQRALEEATNTIRDNERLDLVYTEDLACQRSTLPWYLPLDYALSDPIPLEILLVTVPSLFLKLDI